MHVGFGARQDVEQLPGRALDQFPGRFVRSLPADDPTTERIGRVGGDARQLQSLRIGQAVVQRIVVEIDRRIGEFFVEIFAVYLAGCGQRRIEIAADHPAAELAPRTGDAIA